MIGLMKMIKNETQKDLHSLILWCRAEHQSTTI